MVSVTNLNDFTTGFSAGYLFSIAKAKEDEIRQGANHFMAAFSQVGQVVGVVRIVSRIADKIATPFLRIPAKTFLNIAPLLSVIPLGLMGVVRQGLYNTVYAAAQNVVQSEPSRIPLYSYLQRLASLLPEKFSDRTVKVINYTAENFGSIARIIAIASSALLIVMGDRVFGAAVLANLAYEVVDHRLGLVPHRVSLFMETYMPTISLIATVFSSSLIMQIYGVIGLAFYFEASKQFMYQNIDAALSQAVGYYFKRIGVNTPLPTTPTLKEIYSPVQENKNLSFEVIKTILKGDDADFEINPAHCVRATTQIASLPESRAFDDYLALFNTIDWNQKFDLIKGKCKTDDRFLEFLSKETGVSIDAKVDVNGEQILELVANFDTHLKRAADKKGISVEGLVVDWFKKQMSGLVDGLMGRRRMEGTQQDVEDAMQNCAKILPHLKSLLPVQDRVEIEDTLLALTVEGGYYCARGVKRCSHELLRKIFYRDRAEGFDPVKDYELKISQTLEDTRAHIIESFYDKVTKATPDVVGKDVHGFDLYRRYLTLPFFPMTSYERFQIDCSSYGTCWNWRFMRIYDGMYKEYKKELDEAIHQNGEIHFTNYMLSVIKQNTQLTAEEKEAVLELYTGNKQPWSSYSTEHRFHRLMLVMQGVLRQKAK